MDGFPELAETHLESLPYISTKQSGLFGITYFTAILTCLFKINFCTDEDNVKTLCGHVLLD